MPIGDVRVITASQLVFVTLLSYFVLGEACGCVEISSVLVTLIGMVFVTNPPFIFGQPEGTGAIIYDKTYFTAAGMALLGSLFQAIGYIMVAKMADLDFGVVILWRALFGLPVFALLAWTSGSFDHLPSSLYHLFLVLCTGVLGFISQTLMTISLQTGGTGILSLVRKAGDILLAYALQIFWFDEVPTLTASAGSIMILGSVMYAGGVKILKSKNKQAKA